jgi:uroporphyrin-III C-methyltransferase / precorrin-2 dehydrogenase / sirohydrochlorin ferrochelatase
MRLIKEADVILHDRLVSQEILNNAAQGAEVILTGKQKGAKCTPQTDINDLIVQYALQGKKVVRLKGGDVSFFSNILDELEAVTNNEIEFEIIPGVTAASGCAAYCGIPLTARGYSTAVRFITLHQTKILEGNWNELAATSDTLVFYMSYSNIDIMIRQMLEHGADSSLPLVVIEQGTTPNQREYFSDLNNAIKDFEGIKFTSPATIIIGRVVSLAQKFKWFDTKEKGVYFKELSTTE